MFTTFWWCSGGSTANTQILIDRHIVIDFEVITLNRNVTVLPRSNTEFSSRSTTSSASNFQAHSQKLLAQYSAACFREEASGTVLSRSGTAHRRSSGTPSCTHRVHMWICYVHSLQICSEPQTHSSSSGTSQDTCHSVSSAIEPPHSLTFFSLSTIPPSRQCVPFIAPNVLLVICTLNFFFRSTLSKIVIMSHSFHLCVSAWTACTLRYLVNRKVSLITFWVGVRISNTIRHRRFG